MLNYMISLKIKLIVNGNSVNDEVTNKQKTFNNIKRNNGRLSRIFTIKSEKEIFRIRRAKLID